MTPRLPHWVWLGLVVASCSSVSEVLTSTASRTPSDTPDAATGADASDADAQVGAPGTLTTSNLDAGTGHSCASLRGALYCWGDNSRGQLGSGDTVNRTVPTRVGVLGEWSRVATGATHTCALDSSGGVSCFGANDSGQLGLPASPPRLEPAPVPLPSAIAAIITIATESNHVCAVASSGALVCWGENFEGEIGQGDAPPFVSPFLPTAVGTDLDWLTVDTGQGDTCGLRGTGDLYCWGRNTSAELGLGPGAPAQTRTPTRVGMGQYSHVEAGQDHTCAIQTNGALACWGANASGNLGTGDRVAHDTPTLVGTRVDWSGLSLDTFHSCAIDTAQHLYCWGRNVEGQLGVGDNDDRLSPALVPGDGFVQVAVGRFHTCALKADDSVWCTGANDSGQLGLGDTVRRNAFTELTFP